MKIFSYIFIAISVVFVSLLSYGLMTDKENILETVDFEDLTRVKASPHLITAFSILIFGYQFQFIIFPTYVELENRSTERMARANAYTLLIYSFIFIATGTMGLLMFQSDIDTDILVSLATRRGVVPLVIRSSFCILLMIHIPYYFFTMKEYTLVLYDEIANRALSTHLELKLAEHMKKKEQ